MEFILILERVDSAHETYLNYCQWTHNEAEMTKLIKYIKSVNEEHTATLGPNTSCFYVSETLIPEAVVDGHLALEFNVAPNPFYKYTGVFTCPSFLKKDKVFDEEEHAYDGYGDGYDSDATHPSPPLPKRKNSWDMDLDEEPEEVDAFECAHRLSHYFGANGFANTFINPPVDN
jgi:hypothetical protein